jgi:heme-degrading monooxygenase HmoA
MYIAMNRFKIIKGEESEFERIWTERDTHLNEAPGFVEFCLLRGPENEVHTLSVSHTVWETEKYFEGWIKSDAFRKAHANAGGSKKSVYMGHPQFDGFEAVQVIGTSG